MAKYRRDAEKLALDIRQYVDVYPRLIQNLLGNAWQTPAQPGRAGGGVAHAPREADRAAHRACATQ